ncbi:Arylacetamide deacetylase [Trichoderma cornu-damae]|uniref:Arylacetamide deacetylase n=2 Tax=Trichoderma TaxID=5543 RepID=A0A9P8QN79_9HYPO|nr:Arylacetamide deacetylase [Trichoderma cornu-damae]
MGSDSRPVCHRCAQIKQACDGSVPCARCLRLSLPCRPRDSNSAANQQAGDLPKARIRRVQTGCLMCKRRKKKCDEAKPRCGDCRRLCLDCAWPPERHKDGKPAGAAVLADGAPASAAASIASAESAASRRVPAKEPGAVDAATDVTTELIIRGGNSPAMSPSGSSSSGGSSSSSSSSSTGGGGGGGDHFSLDPHHRFGGLPPASSSAGDFELELAAERAAWDPQGSSPVCWHESITPISYDSPRSDSHDAHSLMVSPMSSMSSLSVYNPQLLPQLSSPHDRALLNHYATIVSSLLSRRMATSNPYNGYLLPIARSNDLVMHCILALSANHWRKLQPQLADRGIYHQSKATQALARLLPHVDRSNADIALVSSLLLCMTELFDGTSEGWKLHLKGAKRLLTALMNQQQGDRMNGHNKFLVRLARFLDSAATTSTCKPPLMGEDEQEAATLDRLTAAPDEEDSAIYGIPKELFHLVDVVNALADKRKNRVDRASEAAFRREALQIEDRINHWSYEYGGLSRAAWTINLANDDVLYATMAYEYAIRLRLHQIVEGYDLNDPRVVTNVEGILESVQKIRYGSPLEPCLMYPLVMAGGACWTMEQRVVIQDRLLVMERTCGFGYIYNARELVERVWRMRDQTEGTGTIVNWARIRYEEMHGLAVF